MHKYNVRCKSNFDDGGIEKHVTVGTYFGNNKIEALKNFLNDANNLLDVIEDDFVIDVDHISSIYDKDIDNIISEYYYLRDRRTLDEQKH